ncbi:MAG: hypothetical protein MOIL_00821 [Candidatus Methanolliviera sp. GoM_oil]|nr:MAG: hypothetical protein MOIL_00821 [Candidatus Methanolliviera sp. GoM_oil]
MTKEIASKIVGSISPYLGGEYKFVRHSKCLKNEGFSSLTGTSFGSSGSVVSTVEHPNFLISSTTFFSSFVRTQPSIKKVFSVLARLVFIVSRSFSISKSSWYDSNSSLHFSADSATFFFISSRSSPNRPIFSSTSEITFKIFPWRSYFSKSISALSKEDLRRIFATASDSSLKDVATSMDSPLDLSTFSARYFTPDSSKFPEILA